MSDRVKTTIYLDSAQQHGLRALARRTGRPQAGLIREAIDALLGQQPRVLPSFVGVVEGELPDAAGSEDWLVAEWDRELREQGRLP